MNPFVSQTKPADAAAAVLHPLVLLSISDHATRHALRRSAGPVIGCVLGQQRGRHTTLEQTFAFTLDDTKQLPTTHIAACTRQLRQVHQDRGLDVVGWYTVLGRSGPTASVMEVHAQVSAQMAALVAGDSVALVAFHGDESGGAKHSTRLPVTVYESVAETACDDGAGHRFPFMLREVAYTVDAGEAETISVDFVARGAANAAVEKSGKSGKSEKEKEREKGKGDSVSPLSSRDRAVAIESGHRSKKRLVSAGPDKEDKEDKEEPTEKTATEALTRDEEELVATLTTRANAVRMLHARLQLLAAYTGSDGDKDAGILRSLRALVQRRALVQPQGAFATERQREANDVATLGLLLDDVVGGAGAVQALQQSLAAVEAQRYVARHSSRSL